MPVKEEGVGWRRKGWSGRLENMAPNHSNSCRE